MSDDLEGGAETRPCEEKTRLRIARKGDGLDFDDNRAWGPLLTAAVGDLISEPVMEQLVAAAPEFVHDALGLLFSYPNRPRRAATARDRYSLLQRKILLLRRVSCLSSSVFTWGS